MTLSRVDLESFEEPTSKVAKSADYIRGFEEGEQSAQKSESAKLQAAVEDISTTLQDMDFSFTEARLHLLDRVRPLLTQVAETILPSIARESFSAHLVDVITHDIGNAITPPTQILVSPTAVDYLSTMLEDHTDSFSFIGDTTLVEGQAVLNNPNVHILIDLPALTKALQTALNGLEPLERSQSNG